MVQNNPADLTSDLKGLESNQVTIDVPGEFQIILIPAMPVILLLAEASDPIPEILMPRSIPALAVCKIQGELDQLVRDNSKPRSNAPIRSAGAARDSRSSEET